MSTRTIHWTEDTKTMMIRTDIPGFFIEFGNQMVYRIKNTTGNTLNPGTVVFFNGSDTFPTVTIADYNSYTNGAELYLAASGSFTATRPVAPLPEVYLGTVIRSGSAGVLSVNVELGFEIEELHNVKIDNAQDGDILTWDSTLQVWKNTSSSIDGGIY